MPESPTPECQFPTASVRDIYVRIVSSLRMPHLHLPLAEREGIRTPGWLTHHGQRTGRCPVRGRPLQKLVNSAATFDFRMCILETLSASNPTSITLCVD